MPKVVLLEDDELGREGDIVDVSPQTALDLLERGTGRVYMGVEEEVGPVEQEPDSTAGTSYERDPDDQMGPW